MSSIVSVLPAAVRHRVALLPLPRRLYRGDVDLLHTHHCFKRALCFFTADRQRVGQHSRRDLPGDAPLVFAPTARALLAAIANDGIPVAVSLLLILGGDLDREGFVVLEDGAAVEADAGYPEDRECDRQHIAFIAGRVVAGGTVDGTHRAVGKRLGVEAGCSFGVLVIPKANRVLGHSLSFPLRVKLARFLSRTERGQRPNPWSFRVSLTRRSPTAV